MTVLAAQLVVLAKEPRPGRVKTRLTPALTPAQAASVALAALEDTLAAVVDTPVLRRTVVLDGAAGPWLPDGFAVLPQRGAGLDERLAAAFDDVAAASPEPILLVGMDTPQLTAGMLSEAVRALLSPGTDAVLGLAEDGGWWALGLRAPRADALLGVPMSTAHTGADQVTRLDQLGLRVTSLPVLRDIDQVADLAEVGPALPPTSHLARLLPSLLRPTRNEAVA
jgi:uncharacterized protein